MRTRGTRAYVRRIVLYVCLTVQRTNALKSRPGMPLCAHASHAVVVICVSVFLRNQLNVCMQGSLQHNYDDLASVLAHALRKYRQLRAGMRLRLASYGEEEEEKAVSEEEGGLRFAYPPLPDAEACIRVLELTDAHRFLSEVC